MKKAEAEGRIPYLIAILRPHRGEENAIAEKKVAEIMDLDERDVRDVRAIAEEFYPILSTSGSGLYWGICRDDFDHPIAQDEAMSIAYRKRRERKEYVRDSWFPLEPVQLTLVEAANDA